MSEEKRPVFKIKACCYLCSKWCDIQDGGEIGYCPEKGEYTEFSDYCEKFALWDGYLDIKAD